MEEHAQEEPISMEPLSPSKTKAAEDLSFAPEHSVDSAKESPKLVGQLEKAVNAKVNSEAAAASDSNYTYYSTQIPPVLTLTTCKFIRK